MKYTIPSRIILISFISFCFSYCGTSQNELIYESQDIVKKIPKDKTDSIALIIGDYQWSEILKTTRINIFKIDSVLIDKSTNEYGRKVINIDNSKEVGVKDFLLQLTINDTITQTSNTPFNPSFYFELCEEKCENSMVLDTFNNKIGFVSLQGRYVFHINKEYKTYLTQLIKKK